MSSAQAIDTGSGMSLTALDDRAGASASPTSMPISSAGGRKWARRPAGESRGSQDRDAELSRDRQAVALKRAQDERIPSTRNSSEREPSGLLHG